MRRVVILSALVFSALPLVGVGLFAWSAYDALTLLCADLIILTMLGAAEAFMKLAPPREPILGRIAVAGVMIFLVAGVLAGSADRFLKFEDLGVVLARSEIAAAVMLLALARMVEYAAVAAIPMRPWRTSRFTHPLAAIALGLWFWRPDNPITYLLLLALCIVKAVAEIAAHFGDEKERHEASWLNRAKDRISA